jgi:hypothetical protein
VQCQFYLGRGLEARGKRLKGTLFLVRQLTGYPCNGCAEEAEFSIVAQQAGCFDERPSYTIQQLSIVVHIDWTH